MSVSDLVERLNCERCGSFEEYERESGEVVRCDGCGKRHNDASVLFVQPDKDYRRDEAGKLLEEPP